jgi:hypothetical protein
MIEAKQAIETAFLKIHEYYDDSQLKDLLLEEVIFDGINEIWLITLGFNVPNTNKKKYSYLQQQFSLQNYDDTYERKYKVFEIDGESGKSKSMMVKNVD